MTPPRILVFAGSIRSGALSGKLAAAAAKALALADAEVTAISLADYPLPIYDGDLEREKGVPENAVRLARLIAGHDGVFIATPEYNHSLPPLLKNAIDWVSRVKPAGDASYRHRVYAIGGTSDGSIGGARALIDLRKVLATAVGAIVIGPQVQVSRAQDAFDEAGNLVEAAPAAALGNVARHLVEVAGRMHRDQA